jgi:hypothetical protein
MKTQKSLTEFQNAGFEIPSVDLPTMLRLFNEVIDRRAPALYRQLRFLPSYF